MKIKTKNGMICLAALMLGIASVQAEIITFGGDDVWDDYGLVDGTASPLVVKQTINGLEFTLTVAGTENLNTRADDTVLSSFNSGDNTWGASDGNITLTFAVNEISSTLDSLAFNSIYINALNAADEAVLFTATTNGVDSTVTGRGIAGDGEIDGPLFSNSELFNDGGLIALTKDNVSDWSLTIDPTEGQSSGIGSISLDYTYTIIPEPATLGLIAFASGGILLIRRRIMM